jgi:N-acetylglucosaminyldiphosphoundecaprenol N-acetyl-beta-D-mannosaminyltransferase
VSDRSRPVLFGVAVDPLTMDETVGELARLVESGAGGQHVVLNAGKVVLMEDRPDVRCVVERAIMVNADGQSIVWAGCLLGVPFPERVTGIDLMLRMLGEAERNAWPIYLLGATDEVLAAVVERLSVEHPMLEVAGFHSGYFSDDQTVAREMANSGARIAFVAMPSPRKELFTAEQGAVLSAMLVIGVGGSFDVYAGRVRRAPLWMQRLGLEWAYRLLQEPSRMWQRYLVGNSRFLAIVVREAFRRRRPSQ